jgi:hypothetical protein
MAMITDLPFELWLHVFRTLSACDMSSLSRCNHYVYWLMIDQLFDAAFSERTKLLRPNLVYMLAFFHAVEHDSLNLAQWLVSHKQSTQLNGYVNRYTRYILH